MFQRALQKINSVDSLLYLLGSFALNRLTDWLPETRIQPFPAYTVVDTHGKAIGISWQSYYFFLTGHLTFIFFLNVLMHRVPKMRQLFSFYRAVEIVALFDFFMIFEKPFMRLGMYGLEFTDLRILVYFTLYILWKADKHYL